jgi:DNA-binding Xre family transcriptional regulator
MVSYKPLWRLLVERDMSKCELRKLAGLAPNTMTKMRKNEEVSMTVLNKICAVLNVNYGDIIEYIQPITEEGKEE